MESKTECLFNFVPDGWQIQLGKTIQLLAPNILEANLLAKGAKRKLVNVAERLGTVIEIFSSECGCPVAKFGKAMMATDNTSSTENKNPILSSYNTSSISTDANYGTVLDFIKGKKSEGLIVTITSMVSDKCLMVNDLQALDRGGGWTAQDWIGIDFKTLWRDSFHVGKTNYYGELIATLERDKNIPNFYYQIRRPSGALAEYSSSYHLIDNFLGGPVRVAVSVAGDWRIIEQAQNGSE
jgi:hypothetical protein